MLPKSNMLESIMNVVETLPPEKQREVLDFVEFSQGQLTASATSKNISGWMPGFFEKVVGGWVGESLEIPEQGEYETREVVL